MKKILSLVLTIAMLLTTLSVGFAASATVATEHQASIDGYTGITALPASNTTGGKYFLKNDISVSSTYAFPAGIELNGNGYTISYTGGGTNGFSFKGNATISNVSFGTAGAPISVVNALFANNAAGTTINITDVDFFVNTTLSSGNVTQGALMCEVYGNVTLTRCNLTANLNGGNVGWNGGGYFGQINNSVDPVITLDTCTLRGSVTKMGQCGGFMGQASGKLTLRNCVNYAPVTTTSSAAAVGGFIGKAVNNCTLTIENCVNEGAITTGTGANHIGGIVGHLDACTVALFTGAENKGAINVQSYTTAGNAGIGGIVGYGNCIAGTTLENCTNSGTVTATYETALASGQYHHVTGGIVGRSNGKTITIRNCQNKAAVSGRNDVGGIMGDSGLETSMEFINCVNAGTVASLTNSGDMKVGGILGDLSVGIPATFTNCFNGETGVVGSATSPLAGGIIGQSWTGAGANATLNRCQNLGTVQSSGGCVGGMISQINGGSSNGAAYNFTFNDCVVAGTVKETGSTNIGGFVGWVSAKAYATAGNYVIAFNNCVNKAAIKGDHAAAGFVGIADGKITFTNCINAANVSAGERGGGFVGKINTASGDAANSVLTINNSVNLGVITAGTKAANPWGYYHGASGQLIGNLEDSANGDTYEANLAAVKATNAYAFGELITVDGALKPDGTAMTEQYNKGTMGCHMSYASGASVKLIGSASAAAPYSYVADKAAAVAELNANTAFDYTFKVEGDKIVLGQKKAIARGYQVSTDETAVRILATVDSLDYASVGFKYSISVNDPELGTDSLEGTQNTTLVYGSINANVNGIVKSVSAEDMGGEYIYAITFKNLPMDYEEMYITISTIVSDGTNTYEGAQYRITFDYGSISVVEPGLATK